MIVGVIAALALPPSARAQTPATPAHDPPPIGATYTANALTDLPASGNVLSLLDVTLADVISDRVDSGGMSTGQAARIGAHGTSWTQTTFRIGDIDITDPDGSGTPMLLPGVLEWSRVDAATGMMSSGINSSGLAVSLTPVRPGQTWMRSLELFAAPPQFGATLAPGTAPVIARLSSFTAGHLFMSGPIVPNRLGAVVTAAWTASSRHERGPSALLKANLASAFGHLVFTPTDRDEWRLLAWTQRATAPVERRLAFGQPLAAQTDASVHVQVAWDRRTGAQSSRTVFAGVTRRSRTPDLAATASIVMERLRDGPPASLVYPAAGTPGTNATWSAGMRLNRRVVIAREHTLQAGLEAGGSSVHATPAFTGLIGELVNGLPARVWSYQAPSADSRWTGRTLAAYVTDRIQVTPRLVVDGGLRFDWITGSAAASRVGISWRDVLPSGGLRYEIVDWAHIAGFARYSRTAHRLPLTSLAWGDPSAPVGNVYRWNSASTISPPQPGDLGVLIQRVGPGTGGSTLTAIDPDVKRPHMDEIVLGFESRPLPSTVIRLSAMASRQRQLTGVVNTGVPSSSYSIVTVPDTGIDVVGIEDDQMLATYNRNPATFGLDQYLFTNVAHDEATLVGIDLSGQTSTDRVFVLAGFTASRSEGISRNIGFLPVENDIGVPGDVFMNPNARDHAQGRLFTERGYTAKTAAAYRFHNGIRAGLVARYQDGQHFARLVVAPNLNQGPELVRAFRNGRTRFTYSMTVDARLQKAFTVRDTRVTALVDAYNLFNQSTEIEEAVVSGPLSRKTTATQPPRAVHVGLRLEF